MVSAGAGSTIGAGLRSGSWEFTVGISSTPGVVGATEACSALGAVIVVGVVGVATGIATAGIAAGAWVGIAGIAGKRATHETHPPFWDLDLALQRGFLRTLTVLCFLSRPSFALDFAIYIYT